MVQVRQDIEGTRAGVGKERPAGQMWPATAFSVARGSIHENLQI